MHPLMADGTIENYRRVARGEKGGHAGPPWYHGLICEVIRGVSDILAVHYDKAIDQQMDEIIETIGAVQDVDPEGWINPYTTLMCPEKRWSWHGCPCCPPMLLKLVGVMPSYIFAAEEDNIWLNLHIDSKVALGDAE